MPFLMRWLLTVVVIVAISVGSCVGAPASALAAEAAVIIPAPGLDAP